MKQQHRPPLTYHTGPPLAAPCLTNSCLHPLSLPRPFQSSLSPTWTDKAVSQCPRAASCLVVHPPHSLLSCVGIDELFCITGLSSCPTTTGSRSFAPLRRSYVQQFHFPPVTSQVFYNTSNAALLTSAQRRSTASSTSSWCPIRAMPSSSRS